MRRRWDRPQKVNTPHHKQNCVAYGEDDDGDELVKMERRNGRMERVEDEKEKFWSAEWHFRRDSDQTRQTCVEGPSVMHAEGLERVPSFSARGL